MPVHPWMREPRFNQRRGFGERSRGHFLVLASACRTRDAPYGGNVPGGGLGLMAKLPSVRSRKVVKAFESFGWHVARQESSHLIMVREGEIASLSVPSHNPVAK